MGDNKDYISGEKILTLKQVIEKIGNISRSHFYNIRVNDETFPLPISGMGIRYKRWRESDIDKWLANQSSI